MMFETSHSGYFPFFKIAIRRRGEYLQACLPVKWLRPEAQVKKLMLHQRHPCQFRRNPSPFGTVSLLTTLDHKRCCLRTECMCGTAFSTSLISWLFAEALLGRNGCLDENKWMVAAVMLLT